MRFQESDNIISRAAYKGFMLGATGFLLLSIAQVLMATLSPNPDQKITPMDHTRGVV